MSGEKVLELSELSFDEFGINENLLRGIYGYGFEKPSIIQNKAMGTGINIRKRCNSTSTIWYR